VLILCFKIKPRQYLKLILDVDGGEVKGGQVQGKPHVLRKAK